MPLLDLPLAQLKTYAGRSPRPDDVNAFWDRGLSELAATPPEVTITPATQSFAGAECFDLVFTGTGGARVYAKFLRPQQRSGKVPLVVRFHGYSMNSGEWFDHLGWIAQGYAVLAMDCRGQGGRSHDNQAVKGWNLTGHIIRGLEEDTPDRLYYRHVFLDTARLAGIGLAMPEIDSARVYVYGGSQGGGLAIACAALEPRVAKCASVFPFLADYRRVWEMDLCKDAYKELNEWFRRFDPTHIREDAVFTRIGYVDIQWLAHRITGKTLMFTGLADAICPPSTQFAVYNKMTCPKDVIIYPDYGHEHLPGHMDTVSQFFAEPAL